MKTLIPGLAMIACGLFAGASQMHADVCSGLTFGHPNLVNNCGFETGDFTNWTFSGNTANPSGNYYGVDAFDAHSGNNGAYLSQDFLAAGKSPVVMNQTINTTAGANYQISFFLEQDTAPTTGYTHAFSALFGATTLVSLSPTVTVPGTVGSWVQYTFDVMATSATTTLQFSFENDDNYWSFDDVTVALAPEPASSAGACVALLALGLLWFRRHRLNLNN